MAGGGGSSPLGKTWRLLIGKERRGAMIRVIEAIILISCTVHTCWYILSTSKTCFLYRTGIVLQHCHALTFLNIMSRPSTSTLIWSPYRCEHTSSWENCGGQIQICPANRQKMNGVVVICAIVQIGPKSMVCFDPRARLGTTWPQDGPKMAPIWTRVRAISAKKGTYLAQSQTFNKLVFNGIEINRSWRYIVWNNFPMWPRWPQLGVKLSPKSSIAVCSSRLALPCAMTWISGSASAKHNLFSPTWHPNRGPWAQLGAKLVSSRANFSDSMWHAEILFPTFLGFRGVRAKPCCPHWASFGARCSHTGPCAC